MLNSDGPWVATMGHAPAMAEAKHCWRESQRMERRARSDHWHHSSRCWSSEAEAERVQASSEPEPDRSAPCQKLCAYVDCHGPMLAPSCRHDLRCPKLVDLGAPFEDGASDELQAHIGSLPPALEGRFRRKLETCKDLLHKRDMHCDRACVLTECTLHVMSVCMI